MKKFLSVLLTIAMVMSLFTGTVLAAPVASFNITAGTATYEFDLDTFAAEDDVLNYVIKNAALDVYTTVTGVEVGADDVLNVNTANLTVASTAAQEVYTMTVTNVTAGNTTLPVTINVRHILTINGSTSSPKAVLGQTNTFTGTVLTNGGVAVKNMNVSFRDAVGTVLASTTTDTNGAFTLSVSVNAAALYYFYVGTVSYKSVSFDVVSDLKVEIDSNPATLRSSSQNVVLTFDNKTGTTALTGAATEYHLVNITTPDGTVLPAIATWVPADGEYAVTVAIPNANFDAGTYTVDVTMFIKNTVDAVVLGTNTATDMYKIADAADYKPYRSATTTFTVVDNTDTLYTTANVATLTKNVPVSMTAQNVNLSWTSPSSKLIKKVTYTVTGPVVSTASQTITIASPFDGFVTSPASNDAGATYTAAQKTITVNGEGVITIAGTATYDDDTTETFSKTITVSGYMAAYTPAAGIGNVGDEVNLQVVVTDIDGLPINNATVTWYATDYLNSATAINAFKVWDTDDEAYGTATNTTSVIGATTIIQNGVYAAKIKLVAPAKLYCTVTTNGGVLKAFNTQTIYGTASYSVAAVADLIAGKSNQSVTLKMVDTNGTSIKPTYVFLEDKDAIVGGSQVPAFTYDGNSVKLTFAPTATGTFNILVGTTGGEKMVVVPVNVVAPAVKITVNGVESNTITAGVREKVVLTFDSSYNGTLTATIKTDETLVGNPNTTTAGAGTAIPAVTAGVVTIYPEYALYDDVTSAALTIKANFGSGAITVATLTVANPKLDLGGVKQLEVSNAVDLSLTLTDANGVAMKGYEIIPTDGAAFAGNATVETDANGKAVLSVSPTAVGKLTLQVTDLDAVWDTTITVPAIAEFAVTIPVVRDNAGPIVAVDDVYTVTTLPSTITFKVTDGSKVAEVWIGDTKALLRPDGNVKFTVSSLSVGVNTFEVLAYDTEGNATLSTLNIEYLKPATVILTIGSTDATKDGAPMTGMDQAPVIVNGRTFLPVRFVFENLLGGTVGWNQATQTITSVVKGNTIQMVIGSKTAVVNGVNVTLLEAPFVASATNRTLVPMREIMEAIGVTLDWNAVTQTVTLVIPQ